MRQNLNIQYIQDVENAIYADDHINDKGQALSDLLDMDSAIENPENE